MRFVASRHGAGTIAVMRATTARFAQFYDAWEALEVPEGTRDLRLSGVNVVKNCNEAVRQMTGDWLWFMGDDHTFPPDRLQRLLDREADAIVPLVPRWGPPYLPVVYKVFEPMTATYQTYSWQELWTLRQMGETRVPIAAAGSAGLLVRRRVLDALRETYGEPVFRVGLTGADELSEDLELTWKITKVGFRLEADLEQFMGHLTTCVVEPWVLPDGRWAITADVQGGRMPAYVTHPLETAVIG